MVVVSELDYQGVGSYLSEILGAQGSMVQVLLPRSADGYPELDAEARQ